VGQGITYDQARKQIVMFGGFLSAGPSNDAVNTTWLWDGTRWAQPAPAHAPAARTGSALVFDEQRQVVVLFGGQLMSGMTQADVWEWDGVDWTERTPTAPAVPPPGRQQHCMAYDTARGQTVVFGGVSATGTCSDQPGYEGSCNDTWEWNGFVWTPGPSVSSTTLPPRTSCGLAYDQKRARTVLYGGFRAASQNGGPLGDLWEWDGVSWTPKTTAAPSPGLRYQHSLVYDTNRQKVVFLGGIVDDLSLTYHDVSPDEVWEWDGTAWSQRWFGTPAVGNSSLGGSWNAIAYDPTHHVVIENSPFGGQPPWLWDGTQWRQKLAPRNVPARSYASLFFDDQISQAVLFGGSLLENSTLLLNDTWLWNGTEWQNASPATSPSARFHHTAAYDRKKSKGLLFGGFSRANSPSTVLGDTWSWNGVTWKLETPVTSPSARANHTVTYDAAAENIVLFGGQDEAGAPLGDLWLWDANAAAWTQANPAGASPAPRHSHAAAYDPQRKEMVLFGGGSPSGELGDLWTWNGTAWVAVTSTDGPEPRKESLLVWDQARTTFVLFGGTTGGTRSYTADTWLLHVVGDCDETTRGGCEAGGAAGASGSGGNSPGGTGSSDTAGAGGTNPTDPNACSANTCLLPRQCNANGACVDAITPAPVEPDGGCSCSIRTFTEPRKAGPSGIGVTLVMLGGLWRRRCRSKRKLPAQTSS